LGVVSYQQEKLEEAIQYYQRALQLRPNYPEALFHLGVVLEKLGKLEEAIANCQRALQLKPDYPEVYLKLGEIFLRRNPSEQSLAYLQKAVQIKPDYAEAWYTLGGWFSHQNQIQEAVTHYRKAIEVQPDYRAAHFAVSLTLLESSNFTAVAWQEFLYRPPRHQENARILVVPQEKVVPLLPTLAGQRFFLDGEQGLGDELFFLRFAPLLKQRGVSWIAYLSGKKLESILKRVPWLDQVTSNAEECLTLRAHQQWQIGDLPYLLGVEGVDKLPPPVPLSVLPQRWLAMQKRLEALGPAPYLGLTWWAGTKPEEAKQKGLVAYYHKSVPLAELSATLRPLNATILVLQRHPVPEEMETLTRLLGRPIYDLSSLNDDLEEMLALLSLLDEYVGVSNTNMHLMAGLGKMARVLVPHPPEWRWMIEGEESPWFKDFRVYRQQVNQEWGPALAGDVLLPPAKASSPVSIIHYSSFIYPLPSAAVLTTSANCWAREFVCSSSNPSTMTRINGSVPEGRNNIRPLFFNCCSASRFAFCTTGKERISTLDCEIGTLIMRCGHFCIPAFKICNGCSVCLLMANICNAVTIPSPVVVRSRQIMCPEDSPPNIPPCCCNISST
jgi:TPR repeat/Tetratricopeptide repeat